MRTPAFLLLALLLLAGCASPSTPTSTSATHGTLAASAAHGAAANTTTSGPVAAPAVNHAPTANLTATVGNGTAALNVTFTLRGTDPDGDALTWALNFGEPANATAGANATRAHGTSLPANVTHAYKAGGRLNATLTVSDGHNATTAILRLNLTSAAAPRLPPVAFKGHIVAFDPTETPTKECFLDLLIGPGVPRDVVGNIFAFPHPMDGWAYKFDKPGYWTQFWKGSNAILGSGSSGTVPKGSDNVWVCGGDATTSNTDYVLTLTQP